MNTILFGISLGLLTSTLAAADLTNADTANHDAIYTTERLLLAQNTDIVCSAQDPHGRRYLAVGNELGATQETAFDDCLKHADTCYRTGCTNVSRSRRGD